MKYPHSPVSIGVCEVDEKMRLGRRWKSVLSRFVLLVRAGGYTRLRNEGDVTQHVYDKVDVAVVITRHGIPSIRGAAGKQPSPRQVAVLQGLWDQARRAMA